MTVKFCRNFLKKQFFSQLPTHELNDALIMPTCEYSVHSNSVDGPLLSYTSVGETVCFLFIFLKKKLTQCFVHFQFKKFAIVNLFDTR